MMSAKMLSGRHVNPLAGPVLKGFRGMSIGGISLRPATAEDADLIPATVDDLVRQANGFSPTTVTTLQENLRIGGIRQRADMATIVANDDGQVLGFASFNGLHADGRPEAGFVVVPTDR